MEQNTPRPLFRAMREGAALLVGALLFGMGYRMFLWPNAIVLGGATGIATVLSLFFPWRPGVVSALVNLPLLLLSFLRRGRAGLGRAVAGILATSVAVELCAPFPAVTQELLIAAVFGGAVMGAGLGLAFLYGFTSGGSDLAAYLLQPHFRDVSLGTLVLCIDGTIILLSACLLRDLSGLFYSVASAATYSYVLDAVVSHARAARLALLICPAGQAEETAAALAETVERGITRLHAQGHYTGAEREVLLCAMRPREARRVAAFVRERGQDTFLIFLAAPQVIGRRFSEETVDKP